MATSSGLCFVVLIFVVFSQENIFAFRLSLTFNSLPNITEGFSIFSKSNASSGRRVEDMPAEAGCPRCRKENYEAFRDSSVNERQIRQIRLELVKAKILSKLELTEAPKTVLKRHHFPSLVTQGTVPGISIGKTRHSNSHSEESSFSSILVAESSKFTTF